MLAYLPSSSEPCCASGSLLDWRANAQGKKLGRPQVSREKAQAIRLAKVSGMGERRIA